MRMDIRQGEMVMSRTTRWGQTSFGHALIIYATIMYLQFF